jgi:hypothetical protein
MVVWASAIPRSAIIWTKSRELNLDVRYHRTHRMMISSSKCRRLKRSCAEVGSIMPGLTAASPAFHVCTRTVQTTYRRTAVVGGCAFDGLEFADILTFARLRPECWRSAVAHPFEVALR